MSRKKEKKKKEEKKIIAQEARRVRKEMKRQKAHRRRRRTLLLALAAGGVAAAQAARGKPGAVTPGSGTVTMKDPEPGSLALMLGEMIKAVLQDPGKKALADRMNVSLAIQDIDHPDMGATLIFKGSDVEVANGVISDVDVYIGTELGILLSLAGAGKGKRMLEWLKTEDGKKVLNAVKGGRFKVHGAVKNAQQLLLFQKLLQPAGS